MIHTSGPRALIFASAILLSSIPASAQPQQKLEFEVASIKPNASGEHGMRMSISPGRLMAKNVTAKLLIMQAFNVKDFQISGGPAWIASDHFDLDAKTGGEEGPSPAKLSPDQMKTKSQEIQLMMQSLLSDRFKLKTHEDSKEAPVYALVVGKNGPKLKPAEGGAEARQQMRMGRGQLTATKVTMDAFANQLSNNVGRTVVNKTGLNGEYDIDLEWTPDPGQGPGPFGGPPPGGEAPPPVDSSGPSIFTAVQEKLGLKLEGTKAPVKVIVIDSIDKPSEN
jgi:bla regulator protein blaR1